VRLLSVSCNGKLAVCEAKAQGLLPHNIVLAALIHPQTIMPMKTVLAEFLFEAYVAWHAFVGAMSRAGDTAPVRRVM
jgi:hypothetical protein